MLDRIPQKTTLARQNTPFTDKMRRLSCLSILFIAYIRQFYYTDEHKLLAPKKENYHVWELKLL